MYLTNATPDSYSAGQADILLSRREELATLIGRELLDWEESGELPRAFGRRIINALRARLSDSKS